MSDRLNSASSRLLTTILIGGLISLAAASGCTVKQVTQNGPGSSGVSGAPGARRESVPCKSGDKTLPIEAFDINPAEASGTTCNIANVLDDDGSFAGLDWPGSEKHKIDGREVTGCIAAEFGDDITLESLEMKMRAVGAGCGHACTEGEDGCGTGREVSIFAGPSLEKLKLVQFLPLTTADYFEYRVVIYETFKAKFVAICREPTAGTSDDIGIDAISGFCR